jgi:hypothetical protein
MVTVGCLFLSLAASVPADVPKAKPVVEAKTITEIELPDLSSTMSEDEFEASELRNQLCDMPDDTLADFLHKARRDYTLATEETAKRQPVKAQSSAPLQCVCNPCTCPPKAEVSQAPANPTLYRTTTYQEQLQEVRGPMGFLLGYRRVSVPVETLSTTPPMSSNVSVTTQSASSPTLQVKPVTQQPVRRFVQPMQNCPNGRCPLR